MSSSLSVLVKNEIIKYIKDTNVFTEDPFYYDSIWKNKKYAIASISDPLWIVPSTNLPNSINIQASNNNVAIAFYKKKLYVAFRTSKTHFASEGTTLHIISTSDLSVWDEELSIANGNDVREPLFMEINDVLHLYFFEAGKSMISFSPKYINHYTKNDTQKWQHQRQLLEQGEVPWSIKKRDGKIFLSSYRGSHYNLRGESKVDLYFKSTKDGFTFFNINNNDVIYCGGVSEADFEFDINKNLYAVSRLEDGDKTGFGSHIAYADSSNLAKWQFPKYANKNCFMSPKLFRQGNDVYLISRRQLGKYPFARASYYFPITLQRIINWVSYSLSPKTTSLYYLDTKTKNPIWLSDLPGCGDTAFPSIWRIDEQTILVANYSSPLKYKNRTWLRGQLGKTGIYLLLIRFKEQS